MRKGWPQEVVLFNKYTSIDCFSCIVAKRALILVLFAVNLRLVILIALLSFIAATSTPAMPPVADIGIIGAGPSGLATAIALRRAIGPDLSITLFERSNSQQPRGAGLRIDRNTMKAFKAIDPQIVDDVINNSVSSQSVTLMDLQGTVLKETSTAGSEQDYYKAGIPSNRLMGWWELQQLLLKHVPAEDVVFGRTFDRVDVTDDGRVNVWFQEDNLEPGLHCKILIGADGHRSKVALQAMGMPPTKNEHTMMWRARVPASQAASVVCKPGSALMAMGAGPMVLYYPVNNGDVVWTIGAPDALVEPKRSEFVELNDAGQRRKQTCLAVMGDVLKNMPDVDALLNATSSDTVLEHAVFIRDPADLPEDGQPLLSGEKANLPITITGDSFHSMRPTGHGVNCAVEDALVLAKNIAEYGVTAQALRQYEAERIPRVRAMIENTTANGRAAYGEGAVKDAAARQRTVDALVGDVEWPDLVDLRKGVPSK